MTLEEKLNSELLLPNKLAIEGTSPEDPQVIKELIGDFLEEHVGTPEGIEDEIDSIKLGMTPDPRWDTGTDLCLLCLTPCRNTYKITMGSLKVCPSCCEVLLRFDELNTA